jgi:hypothetical protein
MKATVAHVQKRIVVKKNSYKGIDSYDIDNNYPDRVRDIVDNSGMGTTCVNLYHSFLVGDGFENTNFAKAKINRHGLTPDRLLWLLMENEAYFSGFAVHFNYNALFEKSEINFHPISTIRFTNKDSKYFGKYAVYKDWGCRTIEDNWVNYIDKYDPRPEIIEKQVEAAGGFNYYKGQILYVSNRDLLYPKAIYDAVLEDMQTDSKTKTFKYRNVSNNFHASQIIVTSKTENPDNAGEKSNEGRGRRDREVNSTVQAIQDFVGEETAGSVMLLEKESPDQEFDIKKVDIQNVDQLYEWSENSTRDNIRQSFLIPPPLLMNQAAKIGNTQELIDSNAVFNDTTKKKRTFVEEVFREIFTNFKDNVNPEDNYYIMPTPPIKKDNSESNKQVLEIIKDATLSPEQKKDILVLLHEMPEEDAEKLTRVLEDKSKEGGVERDPTQLFNGIQTTSMIGVVDAYKANRLTADEAKAILRISFRLNDEELNQVIGNATTNNSTTDSGL